MLELGSALFPPNKQVTEPEEVVVLRGDEAEDDQELIRQAVARVNMLYIFRPFKLIAALVPTVFSYILESYI